MSLWSHRKRAGDCDDRPEASRTDRRLLQRRQARRRNRRALLTKQAVVKDEGQTHSGPTAIKAWKTETSARYSYTSEPCAVEQKDGRYIVTSRLTGNFPGSPVDLRFVFRLERGKIAFLRSRHEL